MADYGKPGGLFALGMRRAGQTPSLLGGLAAGPSVKRKAFFSFHFDDVFRVNVVRNAWKIDHPDNALMRSFYDSSLWESRRLEGPDSLKALIRDGVNRTSAVCVLVGTETWSRRWVRYEIARAIIDGRGLLAVHLNGINHHQTKMPEALGRNPLSYVAVRKIQKTLLGLPQYYLYEWNGSAWVPYQDYTAPVALPSWLNAPADGHVTPLASGAMMYDYTANQGHKNIGGWIDAAARQAGR